MYRTADFLVEEDVLRISLDPVISTDSQLTKSFSTLIGLNHRIQQFLVLLCGVVYNLTLVELEPYPLNLFSKGYGGVLVKDFSFR